MTLTALLYTFTSINVNTPIVDFTHFLDIPAITADRTTASLLFFGPNQKFTGLFFLLLQYFETEFQEIRDLLIM